MKSFKNSKKNLKVRKLRSKKLLKLKKNKRGGVVPAPVINRTSKPAQEVIDIVQPYSRQSKGTSSQKELRPIPNPFNGPPPLPGKNPVYMSMTPQPSLYADLGEVAPVVNRSLKPTAKPTPPKAGPWKKPLNIKL